jgi:hypothetical protein
MLYITPSQRAQIKQRAVQIRQTVGQGKQDNAAAKLKVKKELTQGETQQLLHILHGELECTTSNKERENETASEMWIGANKDDEEGQNYFEEFSFYNSLAKKSKQKEKTLVNLITKLKGMR